MAAMTGPAEFSWRDFPPAALADAKDGRYVSVCLPARNEAATVGAIVAAIGALCDQWGLVDEVLVVDDASTDRTAEVAAAAGAAVVLGPGEGKGAALRAGLHASKGDLVVFCDADILGFNASFV